MSYLIDGNNLMAQQTGWQRDKPAARRRLLDELAEFMRVKRVSLSVVFDGAPEKFFADGSSYRGVAVFYARAGADADARIKEMVEASRERRTLHVVTSDRVLGEYVRRCGARVVRAEEFRHRMDDLSVAVKRRDATGTSPKEEGRGSVRAGEVNDWMRYFGVDAADDKE